MSGVRGDEPLPPLPPLPADLPRFPNRTPDRGDLDWRNRHLGDGYAYAEAATAGAATARAALEVARARSGATSGKAPAPTRATNVAPRPPARPAKATPAPAPDLEWTPHDAMPPIPTPGHWADGTPINDDEIPEEDR